MALDWLVVIVIALIAVINSQSLAFLLAFTLSNIAFHFIDSGFLFSVSVSTCYALLSISLKNINSRLQLSLIAYSVIHWIAAIDYIATTQETVFYAIFPYLIKVVDCYVIFNLIIKREQQHGAYNSPFGSAWFKRLDNL